MINTEKDKGDDDKKCNGLFISNFRYLCVHEQQVDELVLRFERGDEVTIVTVLVVMLLY